MLYKPQVQANIGSWSWIDLSEMTQNKGYAMPLPRAP